MEFRILGRLEVFDGGRELDIGPGKQRALLAILLVHSNRLVQVERLTEELWGEAAPASAVKNLQILVSRLRKALGAGDRIETAAGGYRLLVGAGELDADRAQLLVAEGTAKAAAGDPAGAGATLRDALGLWRGEPLEDFRYEPFAQAEAMRLDELRQAATEERIDADLTQAAQRANRRA